MLKKSIQNSGSFFRSIWHINIHSFSSTNPSNRIIKATKLQSQSSKCIITDVLKGFHLPIDNSILSHNSQFSKKAEYLFKELNKKYQHNLKFDIDIENQESINKQIKFKNMILSVDQAYEFVKQIVESKDKIYEKCIDVLIQGNQNYSISQQQFFFNVFYQIMKAYIKIIRTNLNYLKNVHSKKSFNEFLSRLNQYFILIDDTPEKICHHFKLNDNLQSIKQMKNIEKQFLISYMVIVQCSIGLNTMDLNRQYIINQKIVIDRILDHNIQLDFEDILHLLKYASFTNLIGHYPQVYYVFLNFLCKQIPQNWYEFNFSRGQYILHFLDSTYKLNYSHPVITNGLKKILFQKTKYFNNTKVLSRCVKILVQFEQLSSEKLLKSHILQRITDADEKNERNIKQNYKVLLPLLYKIGYWQDIQYWKNFFTWLNKQNNYEYVSLHDLYVLFDLMIIDSDIIPQKIISIAKQSKQHLLLKHNIRFEDIDLQKLYKKNFSNVPRKTSISIQSQIASNLRSVSLLNVKNQIQIRIFSVDILINGDTVIEVNNNSHYIYEQPQDQSKEGRIIVKLKNIFRKRVLEKLGYRYFEIDLKQYSEGTYELIERISQLAEPKVEKIL